MVTIESPIVTNLTIVDTPGLISNFNGETKHPLVKQFKEIVRNEIKGDAIVRDFLLKCYYPILYVIVLSE